MNNGIMLLTSTIEQYSVFILLAVIVFVIVALFLVTRKKRKIRAKVKKQDAIKADDFLTMWNELRGRDKPGCYVVTVYAHKPSGVELSGCWGYSDIYIGQSTRVYHRVRNHITGHGNGDVYADIKYGKEVYVRIVPCSKQQLNYLEKDLISAYNATNSYNKTGGGAKYIKK